MSKSARIARLAAVALPGVGMLEGMRVKAGRAPWTFGYLNHRQAWEPTKPISNGTGRYSITFW